MRNRTPFMRLFLLGCLALLHLTVSVAPTHAQGRSQDREDVANRARGAGRIVVATVTDVETVAAQNEYGDQLIISRTTLMVEEALKGPSTPTVILDVEGGTLGDLTLEVSDLPLVRSGDRGVFFVRRSSLGRNIPHQRGHGILKLNGDDRVEDSSLTLEEIRQDVSAAQNGRSQR